MRARTLQRLENSLFNELNHPTNTDDPGAGGGSSNEKAVSDDSNISEKDKISRMLSSYQETVRFLLKQDHHPEVSADDLEAFKRQFQNSAFTCRLSFCPRATKGFESEELRQQHEIGHTKMCACSVPECKYPPFKSMKDLKGHISKHHNPKIVRRSIRGEQHNKTQATGKDIAIESDSVSSLVSTLHLRLSIANHDVP